EMKELAEKAKKFDELLEKGDDGALSKALSELGENLQSLRQMLDQNADLLVMGAYGHSRLREAILGGATRDILDGAKLPVFMAH
ncbi:MAG: universal stress protein, partial [Pseudomonadota bacterium]